MADVVSGSKWRRCRLLWSLPRPGQGRPRSALGLAQRTRRRPQLRKRRERRQGQPSPRAHAPHHAEEMEDRSDDEERDRHHRDHHHHHDDDDDDDDDDGSSRRPSPPPWTGLALEAGDGRAVLLLPRAQILTFTGKCQVTCLYGQVQMFGFTLSPGQPPSNLYSSQTHCALSIEAVSYSMPEKTKKEMRSEARELLKAHLSLANRNQLMKEFSPLCSIVLLERLETSVTSFILSHQKFTHIFSKTKEKSTPITPEDEVLASAGIAKCDESSGFHLSESCISAIEELIYVCREEDDGCPVILACGPKDIGKSTFNRYLINQLLNSIPSVDYLECDLGQTEFTPPGCISLLTVTEPLLGPPFTHQRAPRKMVYYGETHCEEDCERYIEIVKYVLSSYKRETPLIVNTMGWVKDDGLLLLIDLIRLLSPSHVVQFSADGCEEMPSLTSDFIEVTSGLLTRGMPQVKNKSLNFSEMEDFELFNEERGFHTSVTGHKLCIVHSEFDGAGSMSSMWSRARILRDMTMLGYLGHLQPLELKPIFPLHSLIPYQVPFNAVALQVIHTHVAPAHILYAVNASWVGLCRILDEVKRQSSGPILLTQTPMCDCLGFGIVRGIDMEKKLYHILTPVPPEKLRLVNCLLIGNVVVPQSVFKNQPGIEGEIPYLTSEYNFEIYGSERI
ncbi:polynucleotide 5'-hydroxyl-kinase NOL9 [Ornithorhynchus anatinus]|uniref:Polynucleotide 5'-hydroxyl-kinase NOL9 n=1 Tax=Ornithorhynchus anatinus TaxID=9258 RepID=F6TXV6_ORNAN|nr:polynucleotide 5'-hydroxyl-kinase NOL9 [Ornithorhynchus anatinus]